LTALISKVLQSGEVVAAAQSLLARASDAIAEKERQSQKTLPEAGHPNVSPKTLQSGDATNG
jgi:hypothetical protein